MADDTATPTAPLSVDDFAAKVKAKYPDYADVDNKELTRRVLAKYPDYKGTVVDPDAAPQPAATPPPQTASVQPLADRIKSRFDAMTANRQAATTPPTGFMDSVDDAIFRPAENVANRAARFVVDQATSIPGAVKTGYQAFQGDPAAQQRVEDFANSQGPFGVTAIENRGKEFVNTAKTQGPEQALTDAAGDALGMYAAGKATDVIADKAVATPKALLEKARLGAQRVVGAGPQAVARAVGETAAKAEGDFQATKVKNQTNTEDTLRERGKVDTSNEIQAMKDDLARDAVTAQNQQATEGTLRDRGKVDEQNAATLRDEVAARKQALLDNEKLAQDHASKVADTKAQNESDFAQQKDRARVQEQLDEASQQLDQKVADAETKANADNKTAWDNVRKKVGEATTNPEPLHAAAQAAKKLADPADSPIFDSLSGGKDAFPPITTQEGNFKYGDPGYDDAYEEMYGTPPAVPHEPVGFDQLHRWYNWVQDRMYGGSRDIPAGTYQALSKVRDALNTSMKAIAKQAGAEADLDAARTSHTNLKETFSDSPNQPQTVASKTLKETTPEFQNKKARADRLAKVSQYDPSITSLAMHIDNLTGALDALPKAKPTRDVVTSLPKPPTPKALPAIGEPRPYPEPRSTQPLPEPTPPKPYAEPKGSVPFERPTVDTVEVRKELLNKAVQRLKITGYDVGILASSVLIGPLKAILGRNGAELRAGAVGYVGGKQLARGLASNSRFADWIARPPANELRVLNKVPHVERVKLIDHMVDGAVERAKSGQPVSIAPAVAALFGAANVAKIQAAQKTQKK